MFNTSFKHIGTSRPKSTERPQNILNELRNQYHTPTKHKNIFMGDQKVSSHFEKGVKGDKFHLFKTNPIFCYIIQAVYLS